MILPLKRELLELPLSPDEVEEKLKKGVKRGKSENFSDSDLPFMGKVADGRFTITRILKKPENFMPQIDGVIDDTKEGSVIFLKYTLQFSSMMFVVFWTVTTFFFALFLWFLKSELLLGLLSALALIINLTITHLNFRRQLKVSRKLLLQIFES